MQAFDCGVEVYIVWLGLAWFDAYLQYNYVCGPKALPCRLITKKKKTKLKLTFEHRSKNNNNHNWRMKNKKKETLRKYRE